MKRNIWITAAALPVIAGASLFVPVGESEPADSKMNRTSQIKRLDLSQFADAAPAQPVDLVFLHHSCGGQLLADAGGNVGENCIYKSHPNGGGLRALLERNSYVVHEASYNSRIAHRTDVFDWLPKFRTQMDDILACEMQDRKLPEGR